MTNSDLKNKLDELAEHIKQNRPLVQGEDATKLSFVLPFIRALGYDCTNPKDLKPEYVADLANKNMDKVDYAILSNGKPIFFIECKHSGVVNLSSHRGQLATYFASTPDTKFAALTNGIKYLFYTDIEKEHLLDPKPFLSIDLLDLGEGDIEFLEMFCKGAFDSGRLQKAATDATRLRNVCLAFINEIKNPSDEFISLVLSRFLDEKAQKPVVDMYRPYVVAAISDYEAEIRGLGNGEPPEDNGVGVNSLDSIMSLYMDTTRDILTAAEHNPKPLDTLSLRVPKRSAPYVSYRNCSLFELVLDEQKQTVQEIRFFNPYSEQDYRWYSRKITESHSALSASELLNHKDRILAAATDIDEAWRVQSQRIKENSRTENLTDPNA